MSTSGPRSMAVGHRADSQGVVKISNKVASSRPPVIVTDRNNPDRRYSKGRFLGKVQWHLIYFIRHSIYFIRHSYYACHCIRLLHLQCNKIGTLWSSDTGRIRKMLRVDGCSNQPYMGGQNCREENSYQVPREGKGIELIDVRSLCMI